MNIIIRAVNHAFRAILETNGYWVRHSSVLPFGIDYQLDIKRLSETLGISIQTFFDVGANAGQTSSAALENFSDATVFAFEPHAPTFDVLTKNIHSPRFRSFNFALSDREGSAPFFDYGANSYSHSLVENAQYAVRTEPPSRTVIVECKTIDGFCDANRIGQIDVLKVDTEGHDLAVLQGAKEMLASHSVKFVYVEFNSMLPKLGASGGALSPISALLEPLGFCFVASYPVYMIATGDMFVTLDALYVQASKQDT